MKRINWRVAAGVLVSFLLAYAALQSGKPDEAAQHAAKGIEAVEDIVVDEPAPEPEPAPLQGPDIPADAPTP